MVNIFPNFPIFSSILIVLNFEFQEPMELNVLINANAQLMEQLYVYIQQDNVSAHQIGMEIPVK